MHRSCCWVVVDLEDAPTEVLVDALVAGPEASAVAGGEGNTVGAVEGDVHTGVGDGDRLEVEGLVEHVGNGRQGGGDPGLLGDAGTLAKLRLDEFRGEVDPSEAVVNGRPEAVVARP